MSTRYSSHASFYHPSPCRLSRCLICMPSSSYLPCCAGDSCFSISSRLYTTAAADGWMGDAVSCVSPAPPHPPICALECTPHNTTLLHTTPLRCDSKKSKSQSRCQSSGKNSQCVVEIVECGGDVPTSEVRGRRGGRSQGYGHISLLFFGGEVDR